MGLSAPDAAWESACTEHFRRRVESDPQFVALVVDGPEAGLISSGCGWLEHWLPGLSNPSGRVGYIASMSTDEAARGRGLARAIFEGLLAWFDEQRVGSIHLHASKYGEPLYRSYGFAEPPNIELTLRR